MLWCSRRPASTTTCSMMESFSRIRQIGQYGHRNIPHLSGDAHAKVFLLESTKLIMVQCMAGWGVEAAREMHGWDLGGRPDLLRNRRCHLRSVGERGRRRSPSTSPSLLRRIRRHGRKQSSGWKTSSPAGDSQSSQEQWTKADKKETRWKDVTRSFFKKEKTNWYNSLRICWL